MPALTPEQSAILARVADTNDSFIINAKAGSGKTFVLIQALSVLRGDTSLQAFNKAIATEISTRFSATRPSFDLLARTSISTVHSHGLASFRKAGLKPLTAGGKLSFIVKDMVARFDDDDPATVNKRHIVSLASYAKAAGFGITGSDETFPSINDFDAWLQLITHFRLDEQLEKWNEHELAEAARDALLESNRRKNQIDFDDMIYLPLLLNLPIQQRANVLLDEAQDINATRRELAFRTVKPGGRLIAVGDPHQAIYGFTGASVDSLAQIQKRISNNIATNAGADWEQVMPLSTCFRCDTSIIAQAQKIVPGIRAADGKPAGHVTAIDFLAPPREVGEQQGKPHGQYQRVDMLDMPQPGDAILCRLNKPNVAACLGLLRRGRRAKIEGRDLGNRLLQHVQKANPLYAHDPLDKTRLDLEEYLEAETQKLLAKKRETAVALLEDEVDACQLLIDRCQEAGGVGDYRVLEQLVEELFADNIPAAGCVTLASVHKSKGREWPRVFILGWRDYMPFHRATAPWELEQEENLRYVAVTRAMNELVLVNGVQAALDKGEHRNVRTSTPTPEKQA